MMRYFFCALLLAGLVSCASDGPLQPAERRTAALVARSASAASQNGYWKQAAAHWADAAKRYQRIDDWTEAGYAQLGAAQARDKLGEREAAQALLAELLAVSLYPAEIKAEASFQLALDALRRAAWDKARTYLDDAERWSAPDVALRAAIQNSRARLAAGQRDWSASRAAASAALALKAISAPERANALRRLGEAEWHLGEQAKAEQALNEALKLDRELARPSAIREDHCLLATALAAAGDTVHAESCAALSRLSASER